MTRQFHGVTGYPGLPGLTHPGDAGTPEYARVRLHACGAASVDAWSNCKVPLMVRWNTSVHNHFGSKLLCSSSVCCCRRSTGHGTTAMASAGDDAIRSFKFRLFEAMFDESSGDEASLRRGEAETPMPMPLLELQRPTLAASSVAGSIQGVAAIQGMAAPEALSAPSNPTVTFAAIHKLPVPAKQSAPRLSTMGPVGSEAERRSLLDMGPAERAMYQSDRFWWHALVHSGLRQHIAAYSGIVWKMPEQYEDPLPHCMRVIRRLAGNDCSYYAGITESPIRRWEAHCTKYTTMYLLYVAETSRATAGLEQAILREFAFRSLMCENDSHGGESASSASPHYLYVVARESGQLRGSYRAPKRSRMRATVMDYLQGIIR